MGTEARIVLAGTAIAALAGCTFATPPSTADRTSASAPPSVSPAPSEGPVTVLHTIVGIPPGANDFPEDSAGNTLPSVFRNRFDDEVLRIGGG